MTYPFAPSCFNPQDVYDRDTRTARIQEFAEAGRQAGLSPANQDAEKVAVILVDYQYDFINPEGTLCIPGAQDDVARFLSWFYTNAPKITAIYASMDTHLPFQIFFSPWWRNPKTKEHPEPRTRITVEDIAKEIWEPVFHQERSKQYVRLLEERAKKELMIWPYHTMEGTLGHTLNTSISEAIVWHSAARNVLPTYIAKGRTLRSEYYGIFGAEIPDPEDPTSGLNVALLHAIMKYDKIYVAGETKSHCVLESTKQLIKHFGSKPELFGKLYFLKDCTSSVDGFEALAETELATMEEKEGVHMVDSTSLIC